MKNTNIASILETIDYSIELTVRELLPLPHVPLQLEKFVQVVQPPSIGHGCVALHDVILIGDPTQ